jgi:hypothetical protein
MLARSGKEKKNIKGNPTQSNTRSPPAGTNLAEAAESS